MLGCGAGDMFYDTQKGMDMVIQWFKKNIEGPLANNNINISLRHGNYTTQFLKHFIFEPYYNQIMF